jgi:hypothetical protein
MEGVIVRFPCTKVSEVEDNRKRKIIDDKNTKRTRQSNKGNNSSSLHVTPNSNTSNTTNKPPEDNNHYSFIALPISFPSSLTTTEPTPKSVRFISPKILPSQQNN